MGGPGRIGNGDVRSPAPAHDGSQGRAGPDIVLALFAAAGRRLVNQTAQITFDRQTGLSPARAGATTSRARYVESLALAASFDVGGNLFVVAAAPLDPGPEGCELGAALAELAPGTAGRFPLEFLAPGIRSMQACCACL